MHVPVLALCQRPVPSLAASCGINNQIKFTRRSNASQTLLGIGPPSSLPGRSLSLRPRRTTTRASEGEFVSEAVEEADVSEYSLSFLWLDKNLAVSVDQVFGRGHRSPITEYYWWPREDAWENLKKTLDEREARDWISHHDKVILLNTLTEVINFWTGDEDDVGEKPSVRDAISKYPHCNFQG